MNEGCNGIELNDWNVILPLSLIPRRAGIILQFAHQRTALSVYSDPNIVVGSFKGHWSLIHSDCANSTRASGLMLIIHGCYIIRRISLPTQPQSRLSWRRPDLTAIPPIA
jgi:hypothetical protein